MAMSNKELVELLRKPGRPGAYINVKRVCTLHFGDEVHSISEAQAQLLWDNPQLLNPTI